VKKELYYISSPYSPCGNSVLWWAIDAHGYTCDLTKAWKVPREKAESILMDKRGDRAYLVSDVDKLSQRYFDFQRFKEIKAL
jgi:hypothetical protein